MSYCPNLNCSNPYNPDSSKFCQSCGTKLLLAEQYRILKLIGAGGFGRTLLAEDEYQSSESQCVIKQFYYQGQNQLKKAVQLFRQEAARLEKLGEHPQIPELLDYFEQDNNLYIVQEFVNGENLAQELATTGAFPETQIRSLLSDLLPVLQFIHQAQIIHRDIKPENIIRRYTDDKLVLVDFGAAKYATATTLAKTGTTIGSAGYAAPEQAFGKAVFASDIYSLGVTCIHLLTQTEPFDLYDVIESNFAWRDYLHNNPVSEQLAAILDKMIQSTVKQRYQSVTEVLQAWERLKDSKVTSPKSHTPLPRTAQTASSRITSVRVSLTATLYGHSDGIFSVAFSPNSRMLASGSRDKTVKLWQLKTAWEICTLGGWLSKHSGWVRCVAFSSTGKTVISGSNDGTIKLWNVRTGKNISTLTGHDGEVYAVAVSPYRQLLISGSKDKTVKLWDVLSEQETGNFTGHAGGVYAVAISSDEQLLASGSDDYSIKLWHVNTKQEIDYLTGHDGEVYAVAFSPDGELLASGSEDKTIKLWSVRTGKEIYSLTGHTGAVYTVAFSPDGQFLASGSEDETIRLWNLSNGLELSTIQEHSSLVYAIAFSPDGRLLASGSQDSTIKIWRINTKK
ncbi:protein kinase domain-containing protein [Lyngbya aestuarii]|uniref:protein kinase domain-containing protein n=1 Tax=Lyngbya aestuarii TaxID=118322 RepID=UPI00403DACFD